MLVNFTDALRELGPDAGFRIANAARPPADYVWANFLPERNVSSYSVESGSLTVRATMAGLVGMDSPYPPGGVTEISTFLEQSAKIAIDVGLPERTLRAIQDMLVRLRAAGGDDAKRLATEALNFYNKVVVQALLDTAEWLRGQAMQSGSISWVFNGINLAVDYGVPTSHILTHHTGNDAWDGSTSQFWADWRAAQSLLNQSVRAAIVHPDTFNAILDNDANNILVVSQTATTATLKRLKSIGGNTVESSDARDVLTLMTYGAEGEIFDPTNPGRTITVPFMSTGKIVFVGNNQRRGYRVGEGSTPDPVADLSLGYTHVAPTVEGGAAGRWGRIYTPEDAPWQLRGQGVQNVLPVLENPEKIVIASSDIS